MSHMQKIFSYRISPALLIAEFFISAWYFFELRIHANLHRILRVLEALDTNSLDRLAAFFLLLACSKRTSCAEMQQPPAFGGTEGAWAAYGYYSFIQSATHGCLITELNFC